MTLSITQDGMTITPTRERALAMLSLRELIADCEHWQAIVADPGGMIEDIDAAVALGGLDRSAALAKVNLERIDDEFNNDESRIDLPSCIIRLGNNFLAADRYGPDAWNVQGRIFAEFIFQVPEEYASRKDLAVIDLLEKVDAVERYLRSPTTTAERLSIDLVEQHVLGQLDPDDHQGQLCRVVEFEFAYMSAQA